MDVSMPLCGLVGPPNAGKSTLFAASTLMDVKIADYPFTTIEPNVGVAYVRIPCVCKELGVKDNPRNSPCIDGNRFVPVKMIDVAGLVPDAWRGRGLGNRFLDHMRRADVLIVVVDASGCTDSEGRKVSPGSHDPLEDVLFIEREIDMWIYQILKKEWDKVVKLVEVARKDIREVLQERLSGLGVTIEHVSQALVNTGLVNKRVGVWNDEDLLTFIREVRRMAKPMLVAANKIDMPTADEHVERMMEALKGKYEVVPISAVAELALRRAAKAGLINYLPGDKDFEILKPDQLTTRQRKALDYIRENVLEKWGSTGVQELINKAFLEVLGMVVVFPVEDENRFTDHYGNVLPDAYLMPKGSTALDLAYKIHTDLGEKFICAIDARSKRRLGADYRLNHRDVIKIMAGR